MAGAWKHRKRWLLGHLPGALGLRYRTKYRAGLPRDAAALRFEAALAEVAGTTCLDLGANEGVYTRRLAKVAAKVIAVEPDPLTVERLRAATADLTNVEIRAAAIGVGAGVITLYRHRDFDAATGARSESASTYAGKRNMDAANAVDVPKLDFLGLLDEIDGPIGVIKIDIEGAEVDLLEALIDSPQAARIAYVFCETHEDRMPELAARMDRLHGRVARIDRPRIDLFWH